MTLCVPHDKQESNLLSGYIPSLNIDCIYFPREFIKKSIFAMLFWYTIWDYMLFYRNHAEEFRSLSTGLNLSCCFS